MSTSSSHAHVLPFYSNCVSEGKPLKILQATPVRVLNRRSSLIRPRFVVAMKVERIEKDGRVVVLHLETTAGTYIKELVHGDLGRTTPSISSLLNAPCTFLALDVTDVRMNHSSMGLVTEQEDDDDD